jgi:hypothetical protein
MNYLSKHFASKALMTAVLSSACIASAIAQTFNFQQVMPGVELHFYKESSQLPGNGWPASGYALVTKATSDSNGYFATPMALAPGSKYFIGAFAGNAPQALTLAAWQGITSKTISGDLNNGILEGRVGRMANGFQKINICVRQGPFAADYCKSAKPSSTGGGVGTGSGVTEGPGGMTEKGKSGTIKQDPPTLERGKSGTIQTNPQ